MKSNSEYFVTACKFCEQASRFPCLNLDEVKTFCKFKIPDSQLEKLEREFNSRGSSVQEVL
jgi:hypothetical protein